MHKPLIANLEYSHNCVCSDLPERYQDTKITYLADAGQHKEQICHLFTVSGDDPMQFVNGIESHNTVSNVRILRKSNDSMDIMTTTKDDQSTAYALRTSNCAFISTPIYDAGIEKVRLFAPSFDALGKFVDSLHNSYNIKITSKHFLKDNEKIRPEEHIRTEFLEFVSAADGLTKRQMEILKLASSYGYYEIPKRISIAKIGEKMDIGESTASELLRKAEKKLLPAIAKIIELQK
ncbi:MAG: helix-turn-helix domain-containing protein [Candidatus Micrarchaeota archaeon]